MTDLKTRHLDLALPDKARLRRMLFRLIVGISIALLGGNSLLARNYYVSPSGNDNNSGTQSEPWKTLRYACAQVEAGQGHVINLTEGKFVESGRCDVPPGVSIIGAGMDKTILQANSSFHFGSYGGGSFHYERALINLTTLGGTIGNQVIKGFTIDGTGRKMWGGIMVRGRHEVEIADVKVSETSFFGMWLLESENIILHDCVFRDNAWAEQWSTGGLMLAMLKNVDMYNLDIYQGAGYGFKTLGGNPSRLENVNLHHSKVSVYPFNPWNGGQSAALALEYWRAKLINCEIYECDFDNIISLVDYEPNDGIKTIRIHHNRIIPNPLKGYSIEANLSNIEIDHNYIKKTPYGIANWSRVKRSNWQIHHNIWDGFWRGTVNHPSRLIISVYALEDIHFYNNTVYMDEASALDVVYLKRDGAPSKGIYIKNNIFVRKKPREGQWPDNLLHYETSHPLSVAEISNNIFDGFPMENREGGTLKNPPGYSESNNLFVDAKLELEGDRPHPFFALTQGSPAIDAGTDVGLTYSGSAPDIGAVEFGEEFSSPDNPDTPDTPDNPDTPDSPDTPDAPQEPEPEEPEEPECLLGDLEVEASCLGDGLYEILLSFTGGGETYTITDHQATTMEGMPPGDYKLGPYLAGTSVDITITDPEIPECVLEEKGIEVDRICRFDLNFADSFRPIRINVGGGEVQAPDGRVFSADTDEVIRGTTNLYSNSQPIEGTELDELYQSERYGRSFTYRFPVPEGSYRVVFHFAEIYWDNPGERIFDIDIESGQYEAKNIDIYQDKGKYAAMTHLVEEVDVSDGILNVTFFAQKDEAKLSAIEVISNDRPETDLDPNSLDTQWLIAPNPTIGMAQLFIDQPWEGPFQVNVIDNLGRKQKEFAFDKQEAQGTFSLDLRGLSPGYYYLIVQAKDVQHALKVNKQ